MPEGLLTQDVEVSKKDAKSAVDVADPTLSFLSNAKMKAEQVLSSYHQRWAKNLFLVKGKFPDDEMERSKVRQRSKLFFRKIWSNNVRLLASLYQAFLKDPDNVRILGRMGPEDARKAAFLQILVEYRRDWMMRRKSLYRKFMTAFMDILECGFCAGLLLWRKKDDGPDLRVYHPENVFFDVAAETPEEISFALFEDFLTKEQMESAGYEEIETQTAVKAPFNIVRSARNWPHPEPVKGSGEKEYPRPGTTAQDAPKLETGDKYRVFHCFYRKGGKIKYAVTNGDFTVYHKAEKDSPYGDRIPGVFGTCLLVAHSLIGEGFPEVQEGPQESYNDTINRRKDNVALFMNRGTIVSRFGNVDIQSLLNSRPGAVTVADDVEAVKERQMGDVTQSAYIEAASEDAQMQELSGVTDIKLGQSKSDKATVAAINQSEAGAKIDMFIATVGETFVRDFYTLLAYEIQRFETDAKVLRVANDRLSRFWQGDKIDDIEDFEADCVIDVGPGTVGRETEIRQTFMAMDRAIMANQASFALLKSGAGIPPQGIELINITEFWSDFMKKIGNKDTARYKIRIPAPPEPEKPAGPLDGAEALLGAAQPQINGPMNLQRPELSAENELQRGPVRA